MKSHEYDTNRDERRQRRGERRNRLKCATHLLSLSLSLSHSLTLSPYLRQLWKVFIIHTNKNRRKKKQLLLLFLLYYFFSTGNLLFEYELYSIVLNCVLNCILRGFVWLCVVGLSQDFSLPSQEIHTYIHTQQILPVIVTINSVSRCHLT